MSSSSTIPPRGDKQNHSYISPHDEEVDLGEDPIRILAREEQQLSARSKAAREMIEITLQDYFDSAMDALSLGNPKFIREFLRDMQEDPELTRHMIRIWQDQNLYIPAIEKEFPQLLKPLEQINPSDGVAQQHAVDEAFQFAFHRANTDPNVAKEKHIDIAKAIVATKILKKMEARLHYGQADIMQELWDKYKPQVEAIEQEPFQLLSPPEKFGTQPISLDKALRTNLDKAIADPIIEDALKPIRQLKPVKQMKPLEIAERQRMLDDALMLAIDRTATDPKTAEEKNIDIGRSILLAEILLAMGASNTMVMNNGKTLLTKATGAFDFRKVELLGLLGASFKDSDKTTAFNRSRGNRPIDVIANTRQEDITAEEEADYVKTATRVMLFSPLADEQKPPNAMANMTPLLEMMMGKDLANDHPEKRKINYLKYLMIFKKWAQAITKQTSINISSANNPQDPYTIALASAMRMEHVSDKDITPEILDTVAKKFMETGQELTKMYVDARGARVTINSFAERVLNGKAQSTPGKYISP